MEYYIVKKSVKNEDNFLEHGTYSLPFEFILPKNLPTSFEHSTGQVRYTLKAIIDIPWFELNYIYTYII